MENANANANPNGSTKSTGNTTASAGEPPVSRKSVESAMDAALGPGMEHSGAASAAPHAPGAAQQPARNAPYPAPYHAHGSVLEGGDSPAVLAQPASAASQGQGSPLRRERIPDRMSAGRRAQRVISGAQDVAVARYRLVTEGTDDFVHDNPWKSIAMAAIGGLIVGLLMAR